jgi:hypothetical protein
MDDGVTMANIQLERLAVAPVQDSEFILEVCGLVTTKLPAVARDKPF